MVSPKQDAKTFFFQGNAVGYFLENQLPTAPARYKYMPYRGPGHYNLDQALIAKGPQSCELLIDGKPRKFIVQRIPEYGVVEIARFD